MVEGVFENRWCHTFLPVPFLNLTDAAFHSDAITLWWRCTRVHAWMTALFPAWAQVSVNQACLQTAERGWNRRGDPGGRVGLGRITFFKNHHRLSTSRDLSNYKSLLILISAPCCECSSSTNVRKDRLRTHVSALPPPQPPSSSFICQHSDKLRCFANISAPSAFPDLPWILFCVAAPQLCF